MRLSNLKAMRFVGGTAIGEVVLAQEVLAHVLAHRQSGFWSKEAGGQLFGRFWKDSIIAHVATGPRKTDRRKRRFFRPDPVAEQAEIDDMYVAGLHYLGTWHTHPERYPSPSWMDISTMKGVLSNANHELPGILFLVVGTADPPEGIHLGMSCSTGTVTFQVAPQSTMRQRPAWGPGGILANLPREEVVEEAAPQKGIPSSKSC